MTKNQVNTHLAEKIISHHFLPYIFIAFAVILIYFRSLFFGYVSFDDEMLILKNYSFISKPSNFIAAFLTNESLRTESIFYRPILIISLMWDAFFSGAHPWSYHLTNLLIHLINCCLLFIFFKKLRFLVSLSFIFSIIFAIHPVLSQAIAWIPGRNDSLLTLFILTSFISFINFIESRKSWWMILHFLFFTLAFFTKESTIGFIPVLLYFIAFKKNEEESSVRILKDDLFLFLIGWISIILTWYWFRNNAVYHGATFVYNFSWNGIYHLLTGILTAYLNYIGKIIFPIHLSSFPILENVKIIFGLTALVLFTILFFAGKIHHKKNWMLGLIWFIFFLAPGIIFQSNDFFTLYEHRLYLPFIGLMIMLMESQFIRKFSFQDSKSIFILSSLLVLLSIKTYTHLPVFQNSYHFWENANDTSPFYLTHQKMGNEYLSMGRIPEAMQEYETSIQLKLNNHEVFNQIGTIHLGKKLYAEAEKYFQQAIQIKPDFAEAITNTGIAAYLQSDYARAKKMYQLAISLQPNFFKAYYNLGILEMKEGQNDSAIIHFKQTLNYFFEEKDMTISMDFAAKTYTLCGNVLFSQNKLDEALINYRKALEINPDFFPAYQGLSGVFEKKGDIAQAEFYRQKIKK